MAIVLYSDDYITLNSYNSNMYTTSTNIYVATDEKSVFSIMRNNSAIASVEINGIEYYFYDIDEIIVDYSDILRSNKSTALTFSYTYSTTVSFTLTFVKNFGRLAKQLEYLYPPKQIPYLANFVSKIPVIAIGDGTNTTVTRYANTGAIIDTTALTQLSRSVQFTDNITSTYNRSYMKINNSVLGTYYSHYVKITDCTRRYAYLRWCSFINYPNVVNLLKSWFFEIESITNNATNIINTHTYENGYNFLQDKEILIKIIQRNCDITTVNYLADIIFSPEIQFYFVDDKNTMYNVQLETDSIEILQNGQRQDFELILKLQKYKLI